ncbi:type I-E CRISPR-associated protein Cas7/Cse4/CasC [Catenulispora sp. NL8]|uniref:Type I-E CRISPR-associated protein Cas7/Cse4/CasC n=1 Tax=Catenulispora pinistramenti TaxID=2705254 RepID=A0ABS5KN26_9ACTN|nr:type I-E CRISPR-associated protein Cas7/Cse4/CasC [Catenulispora pinistramenti]MBS2547462.1 type I-E CRISPR-associated protein Cas7/Cse4/CasC [Catenulispora pinistramenti]
MKTATALPAGRFIDLHVIQSLPFANLNRDDTNSVKTVQFGGVNRTRISSQSWKRAIRLDVEQALGQQTLRTRRLAEAIRRHLHEDLGWPSELATRAGIYTVMASSVGAKAPKPKKSGEMPDSGGEADVPWGTNAMVYVPEAAVTELGAIAIEFRDQLQAATDLKSHDGKAVATAKSVMPGEKIDDILRSRNGIINLMGRMLAELDRAGVDGSVQVAHVISTHATDIEIDYFSAVDDITEAWGDQSGSAHMGHNEYSAGTFYRYTTIDMAELLRNVGGAEDARKLAQAFLTAAINALPQAKKNSTAPHTFPDFIAMAVRADRPLSYVSAFEAPVIQESGEGYTAASIRELNNYASALNTLMGASRAPLAQACAGTSALDTAGLGERLESVDDLVSAAATAAFAPRNGQ